MKRKQIVSLLLTLVMVLTLMPVSVGAVEDTIIKREWTVMGNPWSWELNTSTGELIINGQGAMANYNIELAPWLYDADIAQKIKTAKIGEGITTIGDSAFSGCKSLESITFPSSITSIEPYAFYGTGLTDVTIPGSVDSIGMYAFADCFQLSSVDIENGVEEIEHAVFYRCKELKKINLPDSIHIIREGAFAECASLDEVKIPQGISYLSTDMFSKCSGLKYVEIPSNISNIGIGAFWGCNNIQSVFLSEGVEKIDIGAFADCSRLKEIYIPESISSIAGGEYAVFSGCTNLADIYYSGSKERWDAIPDSDKLAGLRPEIHYNWSGNRSDVPSSWAVDEVEAARENGLIPEELDEKYQENITRQEFCRLAVQLLETVIGRNIDEILDYHNVEIDPNEFNDTKDQNILAMNALRVVFGTEKGEFNPDSTIKRQDAATMLTRLAKVMNESLPDGAALSFSDGNAVSSYAYYAVMFVSNQQDNDGRMVMTGTGENLFSPHTTYTREQAFLSFGRLYDVVKKCTIGQLRIEDKDVFAEDEDALGSIQISSADGYLTNRRVSAADNRRTLLIPYDEYNESGYYDEIIVSIPTRELKSDEYEIWLRPYMDGDICVRVDEGTIETAKPGMVLATVQSAVSCQVWEEFFIASAGNSSGQLLGTHIPITKIGKLDANFYTAGMYIENYRVEPIYRLDDKGNILEVEEFSVSMDVYNSTGIYGAVDVYDANGKYLFSKRIDKFKLSEENLREVFWEAYGLISDAVEGELLTYRQNSASAHTSISQLKVPKGGYIVISNNCNESPGACIYNWTDFFVEGFSAAEKSISLGVSDWNKVSTSFADAILETLEGDQESLIGEYLMEFVQKVNQNYEWTEQGKYVEEVMNLGISVFMTKDNTDIKELFKDCMIEAAGDQVANMSEEAILAAMGPAGQVLNFAFTAFDLMNYGVQVDHFRESPEARSINIQYPNKW